MAPDLHPTDGARYLLERVDDESGDSRAVYTGAVYTPDRCFEYRVELSDDGRCELAPRAQAASAEHEKRLGNFARQVARAAQGKRTGGLPPWPARVLRWRRD